MEFLQTNFHETSKEENLYIIRVILQKSTNSYRRILIDSPKKKKRKKKKDERRKITSKNGRTTTRLEIITLLSRRLSYGI